MRIVTTKISGNENPKRIIEDEVIDIKKKKDHRKSRIIIGNYMNKKLGKKVKQYKLTIPKEFAEDLGLDKDDVDKKEFEAIFYFLNKGTPKNPDVVLTAEIRRKNASNTK